MKKPTELPRTPAGRLKMLRDERGLTQEELATEIQNLQEKPTCSENQISYLETGSRKISAKYAELFSKFFNVDADFILCRDDYRNSRYRFFGVMEELNEEGALLLTGINSFAALCGYKITAAPLSGDIEDTLRAIKAAYTIEKDGQTVRLSLEEMNRLENEVCDMIETRLKYLFKERGIDNAK